MVESNEDEQKSTDQQSNGYYGTLYKQSDAHWVIPYILRTRKT